jgi:cysteine synthase A
MLSLAAMRHVSRQLGRRVGGSTGTNFIGVLQAAQWMREAGHGQHRQHPVPASAMRRATTTRRGMCARASMSTAPMRSWPQRWPGSCKLPWCSLEAL